MNIWSKTDSILNETDTYRNRDEALLDHRPLVSNVLANVHDFLHQVGQEDVSQQTTRDNGHTPILQTSVHKFTMQPSPMVLIMSALVESRATGFL